MLLIFQAFFEKQKQNPLTNYKNNTQVWVQLKNPIENKKIAILWFLIVSDISYLLYYTN